MFIINMCFMFVNLFCMLQIFKEYREILDFKRDERIFDEYKKKGVADLDDYINTDSFDF